MSDATATLGIVIALGVIFLGLVGIVVWWKLMNRQFDERTGAGAMPDYDVSTSANMWKVTDPLDPNQIDDRQFKEIFGMSRKRYIQKELGGWENVDPLRRYQLGNLSEKQYDRLIQDQIDQTQGKPRRRYSNDKSIYRNVR